MGGNCSRNEAVKSERIIFIKKRRKDKTCLFSRKCEDNIKMNFKENATNLCFELKKG
jgi:hypothetical protein